MYNGLSRIKLNELFFTLGSWKPVKFRCTRNCCKYFFFKRVIIRWNQLNQRAVDAYGNGFNGCFNKIRETRIDGHSWTDPLSPRHL